MMLQNHQVHNNFIRSTIFLITSHQKKYLLSQGTNIKNSIKILDMDMWATRHIQGSTWGIVPWVFWKLHLPGEIIMMEMKQDIFEALLESSISRFPRQQPQEKMKAPYRAEHHWQSVHFSSHESLGTNEQGLWQSTGPILKMATCSQLRGPMLINLFWGL